MRKNAAKISSQLSFIPCFVNAAAWDQIRYEDRGNQILQHFLQTLFDAVFLFFPENFGQ